MEFFIFNDAWKTNFTRVYLVNRFPQLDYISLVFYDSSQTYYELSLSDYSDSRKLEFGKFANNGSEYTQYWKI